VSAAPDWVERIDAVAALVADDLIAQIRDLMGVLGEAPVGYLRGDRVEQLRQYLDLRDDPAAWARFIEEIAAQVLAAEEATRLEKMLDRIGGPVAARMAIMLKDAAGAARAVARADATLDRPAIQVRPPLPHIDPIALLNGDDGVGPVPPVGADTGMAASPDMGMGMGMGPDTGMGMGMGPDTGMGASPAPPPGLGGAGP
jgi:hypothetical protein